MNTFLIKHTTVGQPTKTFINRFYADTEYRLKGVA